MKLLPMSLALAAFGMVASCSAWAGTLSSQAVVNVPEPASVAAFIAGLAVLGIARRRRA